MPKKVRKKSAFTNKSAKKSAFTNKSAQKSTLKSTFGSSEPIWILEVPAVPYGGTKRGKRWGSWVGRGAQRWNGGAETIGRRVYKRAARPPRPQLRSHPASMTVTQVARKYLGKRFNFLKFCDKLLSFDWREVFPNQQPGKL